MITYLLTYLFVMTGGALWTGHSNASAEYAIKEKRKIGRQFAVCVAE